jgi:AAA+ ATPase superfamily predicted ATPase
LFSLKTTWSLEKGGVSEASDGKYFEKLGNIFTESIKSVYLKQTSVKATNPFGEDFLNPSQIICVNEISQHLNYKNLLAKKFFGRAKLIEQVNSYLSLDSKFPLIIHGRQGSGKSCLAAFIADKVWAKRF